MNCLQGGEECATITYAGGSLRYELIMMLFEAAWRRNVTWHDVKHPSGNVKLRCSRVLSTVSSMEEQNSDDSDAQKLQEFLKQSMVEYTSDSSKLHEYLKQNLVDFPTGDEELKMFKFR